MIVNAEFFSASNGVDFVKRCYQKTRARSEKREINIS